MIEKGSCFAENVYKECILLTVKARKHENSAMTLKKSAMNKNKSE